MHSGVYLNLRATVSHPKFDSLTKQENGKYLISERTWTVGRTLHMRPYFAWDTSQTRRHLCRSIATGE